MDFQSDLAMCFADFKLCHHCSLTIHFLREVIVQGSVRWPNGLALDMVLDRYIHEKKSRSEFYENLFSDKHYQYFQHQPCSKNIDINPKQQNSQDG